MLYIASGKFARNKKEESLSLKIASSFTNSVWQRKLERSDEFKSSYKRVRPFFLPGRWNDVRKSSEAVLFLSRCSYLVHNHQYHHCSFHCRLERAGDDRRENEIPIKGAKIEHCISYACIDWLFCWNTCSAHLHCRDNFYLASGKRLPVRCHSNWFHSSRKLLVH